MRSRRIQSRQHRYRQAGSTLIEAAPRLLAALSEPLARSVEETPHNLGIRIRAGTWVVAIDAEEVRLETGEIIPAELIVLLCGPRVTMTWDDKLI